MWNNSQNIYVTVLKALFVALQMVFSFNPCMEQHSCCDHHYSCSDSLVDV